MALTKLELRANDESTYVVAFDILDENENPVTPNTLVWSLRNADGDILNSRDQVEIPSLSSSIEIAVYGDDLKFSDGPLRYLTLEGTYDSTLGNDLPVTAEARFKITDFKGI